MTKLASFLLLVGAAATLRAQDQPHNPALTAGVSSGAMHFADGRIESGVTGVLRYHPRADLSIAVSPTFARMAYPGALGGGSISGLTDLPVEMGYDHELDLPWSPALGAELGVSLPVGQTTTGFGSGTLGSSISAGIGAAPNEKLSLHAGAGRPLSDFSTQGALGTSGDTWGEVEGTYAISKVLSATLGFDGDLASSDTAGAARAIAGGFAIALPASYALTMHAAHGVAGPAATWSVSIGFGTDFNPLGALGSSSQIQRFMHAIGASKKYGAAIVSARRGGSKVP